MGSLNFICEKQKNDTMPLKLNESACVQFIQDLPHFKGKFTFEKQSAFNKIERAATQFCVSQNIDKVYVPVISRLLAYNHHHYFAAFKQIPRQLRQQFVEQLINVNIELMDSLSTHFLRKQIKQMNPYTTIGKKNFKLARSIDLDEITIENKFTLQSQGLNLLKNGKVAIFIMVAGHAECNYHTSKSMKKLALAQPCTMIQLMLKRLKKLIIDSDQKIKEESNGNIIPIILICNEDNQSLVKKYIHQKSCFGLDQKWIKVVTIKKWPIVNQLGQLCLNFQYKTLMWPEGSAKCLELVLVQKFKSFLQYHRIQYIHIVGCENLAEFPGDPVFLGLIHKLKRKIAAKCTTPDTIYEKYPRYVCSETNFHLLNMKQLQFIDSLELIKKSPIAMNSMVFHLQSLYNIAQNFEKDLYMSRRYHLVEISENYYDFLQKTPVIDGKCYAFEKDLRDYITCSSESILVHYNRSYFFPINNLQSIDLLCNRYQNHLNSLKITNLTYQVMK